MSHLRQWRGFQVRSIGSVFHTGASLGEYVVYVHLRVSECVHLIKYMMSICMYECLTVVMHVYAQQEKTAQGGGWRCVRACVFEKELHICVYV